MRSTFTMHEHRISQALWAPSPHCDDRPDAEISLIVIHGIALPPEQWNPLPVLGFFQGHLDCTSDPYFAALQDVRVSSHLVVGRGGDVYQCVRFDQRAWHAGVSEFAGRPACNDFSIGIELIGPEEGPFTDAQYESLAGICERLCVTYGISPRHIVGHRDIAPGRNEDPGADFDYARIRPA